LCDSGERNNIWGLCDSGERKGGEDQAYMRERETERRNWYSRKWKDNKRNWCYCKILLIITRALRNYACCDIIRTCYRESTRGKWQPFPGDLDYDTQYFEYFLIILERLRITVSILHLLWMPPLEDNSMVEYVGFSIKIAGWTVYMYHPLATQLSTPIYARYSKNIIRSDLHQRNS
jgi:hypothetical protein